ncbi:MAG: hypothetical protein K2Y37_23555 [Pirellulales bacterium]|nr:hypothetical protein [Pirellulales bacterium]
MPFLAEVFSAPGIAGLHFAPLLAEVRIRWQFFPQSATGWIAAALLAAACLASDWFFHQSRTGGRLFARPDWSKLLRKRCSLVDLLEVICLCAAVFLLSQFYLTLRPAPDFRFNPNVPRLDPNAFLATGLTAVAMLAWQSCRGPSRRLSLTLLGVAGALLIGCWWFHPGGTLLVPVLVTIAVITGMGTNTIVLVTLLAYAGTVAATFVHLWQFVETDYRPLLIRRERLYSLADAETVLFASAFVTAAMLSIGLRRTALYILLLAMLFQQAAYFSLPIFKHYLYPPGQFREYYLDIRNRNRSHPGEE